MKTVCEKGMCTGCMACINVCLQHAIRIVDNLDSYNAVIESEKCINCNACYKVCQQNTNVKKLKPLLWKQGWSYDLGERASSSSGGVAAEISKFFVRHKGAVCSCVFKSGEFSFETEENQNNLIKFKGSKYVKSNPDKVFKPIKQYLKEGKKVLFIGLPCQVAGIKKYVGEMLEKNLYTVDVICHGSPSPKLLELFFKQYGLLLKDILEIQFRKKGKFRLVNNIMSFVPVDVKDRYTLAFLNGLCYTENCYKCQYAEIKRVSDMTIGDSWGSELSEDEKNRGISLILCQTQKGKELLDGATLHLEDVNIKKAIAANHQLYEASKLPVKREKFFDLVRSGVKFNRAVTRCCRKACIKQDIKSILSRWGILR